MRGGNRALPKGTHLIYCALGISLASYPRVPVLLEVGQQETDMLCSVQLAFQRWAEEKALAQFLRGIL